MLIQVAAIFVKHAAHLQISFSADQRQSQEEPCSCSNKGIKDNSSNKSHYYVIMEIIFTQSLHEW